MLVEPTAQGLLDHPGARDGSQERAGDMSQSIPRAEGVDVQGKQEGSEAREEEGSGRGILGSDGEGGHDADHTGGKKI